MEPVGIILLVLFLFILVMGPLACMRMSARNNVAEKVYNPQPRQLDTARRKLSTVTTSTILPRPNAVPAADIEALTPQSEFGECPICIGPLVPEPVHTVTQDPRPVLEEVSTVTSHKASNKTTSKNQATPEQIEDVTSTDDDILTINTCGHSFHSKCLSSWFLIDRHDCPVCRVPYYKGVPRHQQALNVSPFW
ncbi:uncharacterized protein B0J16DRAFT_167985 [Fusarium flagelliforme]|uniref:uncharacterized protein n=1 Tax=Fusarium flagelliforme TaxID=2675880 RepID=UPI001E8E4E9A|nr:uncharacterized protein B0J16DRAFT_167985 [Fusarium flagelliforme]KAH7179229.1 hypothetical protein B0J16DRAFT_167985 [Fusarium flagelliforme]